MSSKDVDPISRDARVALSVVISLIAFGLHSTWMVLFIRRWKVKDSNIIVRNPWLTILLNVTILLDVVYLCILLARPPKLYYFALFHNAYLLSFVFGPYVLKTYELNYRFNLAEEIFRLKSKFRSHKNVKEDDIDEEEMGWFLRNRYLLSGAFEIVVFCVWTLICFLVVLTGASSFRRSLADAILLLIATMVIALLFWNMRGKVDVWRIKYELRNVFLIALFGVIIFIFMFLLLRRNVYSSSFALIIISCFCLELAAFESIARPCLPKLFKGKSVDSVTISDTQPKEEYNFRVLIKNKAFLADFEVWLKKAFSSENLSFLQAVEQFEEEIKTFLAPKSMRESSIPAAESSFGKGSEESAPLRISGITADADIRESSVGAEFKPIDRRTEEFATPTLRLEELSSIMMREAAHIMRVFIDTKGAISVNISGVVRTETLANFEELKKAVKAKNVREVMKGCPKLFEQAKAEIFYMLETDSFPRYIKTEEFKRFTEMNVKVDVILKNSIPSEIESKISSQPSLKSLLPKGYGSLRVKDGGSLRAKDSSAGSVRRKLDRSGSSKIKITEVVELQQAHSPE